MKLKVIVLTLSIFFSGLFSGLLINTREKQIGDGPQSLLSTNAIPPCRLKRNELLKRMEAELDLTDTQHAKVENLIRESQKRTRELWDRMRPQVHAEVTSLRKQIRSELTAVQQQKFDELNGLRGEPTKGKQLMERRNAPIIFTNSD